MDTPLASPAALVALSQDNATPSPARPRGTRGPPPGTPKPAGSGRKAGTGNRVTPEAKSEIQALIERHGPSVFAKLFHIAQGRKMRVGPVAGPDPKYAYPSEASQVKALEILSRKLLPDLKANELTGADGAPLLPATPPNIRETAKSILAVLSEAVPGGSGIAITPPGEHVARFRDKALGERILPNDDESDAGPGHRSYPTPEAPAAAPAPDAPARLYDHVLVDEGHYAVQYIELLPDDRQRWGVFKTNGSSKPSQVWSLLEKRPDRTAAVIRARELMQREKRRTRGEPDPDGRT